jgi:hypothetical protein
MIERSRSSETYLKYLLAKAHVRSGYADNFLTLEYIMEIWDRQDGKCALSGEVMTHIMGTGGRVNTNISIDRIDSSKGYEVGNIQLVCAIVNIMKQNMSSNELISWCKLIVSHGT